MSRRSTPAPPMDPITSFPHLSPTEFHTACTALTTSHHALQKTSQKGKWIAVNIQGASDTDAFLRISQEILMRKDEDEEEAEIQDDDDDDDDDEEVLERKERYAPLIHYDICLSPTYLVPVLYFHVSDTLHRFPPTMDTLYAHIVAPQYVDQTRDVGVLGGITVTDHPVENRPVFFIHPCRTAEVMEASIGGKQISPFEYLLLWIGAMGKCVGLDVPMELFVQEKELQTRNC